jgi:hypothetical protein
VWTDSAGSLLEPVAGCLEHGADPSGSKEVVNFNTGWPCFQDSAVV